MIEEIVFTSAPRGLQTGKKGFCTVAATPNMSAKLLRFLESSSGYRHLNAPGDVGNPVVRSHVKVSLGGRTQHVISRVGDAGMDYSQRSNKIAHHIALTDTASFDCGPVGLMWNDQNFIDTWTEDPRFISPRTLAAEPGFPAPCATWESVAGDAGRAGDLLEAFLDKRTVYLVLEPSDPAIEMIDEAVNLLPPNQRWDFTFSTFFTRTPPGVECQTRVVFPDSPELTAARRSPKNVIIDTRDKQKSTGRLAALAREGRSVGVTAVDSSVAKRSGSSGGGSRKASTEHVDKSAPLRMRAVDEPQSPSLGKSSPEIAPPAMRSEFRDQRTVPSAVPSPWYVKALAVVGALSLLLATAAAIFLFTNGDSSPVEVARENSPTPVEKEVRSEIEIAADGEDAGESEEAVGGEGDGDEIDGGMQVEDFEDAEHRPTPQGAEVNLKVTDASEDDENNASDAMPDDDEEEQATWKRDEKESPRDLVDEGTEQAPAKQSFEPKLDDFQRYILTEDWSSHAKEPTKVFETSLSVQQLVESEPALVSLSDGKKVEGVHFDTEEEDLWKITAPDIGDDRKTIATLSFSEKEGNWQLKQEVPDLRDIGVDPIPQLHEVALQFGSVQIPLKKNGNVQAISWRKNGDTKRPFGDLKWPADARIRVRVQEGDQYSVEEIRRNVVVCKINFEKLNLEEQKEFILKSLPEINYEIRFSSERVAELVLAIDPKLDKPKALHSKIGGIPAVVVLKLQQQWSEKRNELNYLPEDTKRYIIAHFREEHFLKFKWLKEDDRKQEEIKKLKPIITELLELDRALVQFKNAKKNRASKLINEYFGEIPIPLEICDGHGRTLFVTVLFFDSAGDNESGFEERAEKKLKNFMLDVHERESK